MRKLPKDTDFYIDFLHPFRSFSSVPVSKHRVSNENASREALFLTTNLSKKITTGGK